MFRLFSKKPKDTDLDKKEEAHIEPDSLAQENPPVVMDSADEKLTAQDMLVNEAPKGFLGKLKERLTRTRTKLADGLANIFLGKKEIDADLLEQIESLLLSSDLGIKTTEHLIHRLTDSIERKHLSSPAELYQCLKNEMTSLLAPCEEPLPGAIARSAKKPYVILMIGVNGNGKTTTIGKLTKQLQQNGQSVMLAAGDTFRAAAVEQLLAWGERNNVPVIAQHTGADSASVCFDALQSAISKNTDVLILDTAGRLHTKDNLMEELKKVKRVLQKLDVSAPHEVMLVLDAGTGQNAIMQAQIFKEAIGVTGLTLTKLDGTAKGGVIFPIAHQLQIPIRYIGVGEQIDDLRPFTAKQFVDALFNTKTD